MRSVTPVVPLTCLWLNSVIRDDCELWPLTWIKYLIHFNVRDRRRRSAGLYWHHDVSRCQTKVGLLFADTTRGKTVAKAFAPDFRDVVIFESTFQLGPIYCCCCNDFYRATLCVAGLCDSNSVCLSVCLSVTLVDCVHMVRPTIMISSPYGSPIILVSGDITFIPKFEEGHPERGRWMRVGWVRIGDFRPISRCISETVQDTTKVTINH